MLGRLSTQVFLISIAVATVAAVLTGALIRDRTVSAFEDAVARDLAVDSQIYNEVEGYPFFFDSWEDAQESLEFLAASTGERIAITDVDGVTLLADTDPGEPLPAEPVAVLVNDEFGIEFDEIALQSCLADFGIFFDEASGTLEPGSVFDISEDDVDRCFEENQIDPQANALLFLGYATETVDLGDLNTSSLLLGGGGVLLVAALGAVLLARRVSGPVEDLTLAASRLEAGDLSQRVAANGSGEIAGLGTSFNSMASRLEETEESRQRLISDVAHELRNPIGVLQGNLEAAQDGVLPFDDQMISSLVSETHHLAQLVRDLQEISLAEHQGLQINPVTLDLHAVCADVVASHGGINPSITLGCSGDPTPVSADPIRIRQVVENLISNALTHTPDGGSVQVDVRKLEETAIVRVKDSGVGIDARDLPHVFDRFWRGDSSRTRETGGSGLGLSISQAIVHAHGGTITAWSQPGQGAIFTASIPLLKVEPAPS